MRTNGRKVSMGRNFVTALVSMLLMVMLVGTTAFASTPAFSINYDKDGKVVMNNFDSDISKYKPDGVYQETGSKTKDITYYVCPRQIAIVGGYKVNGLSGGVYKLVGPGTYTDTITDGFVMVVDKSVAAKEWQFRLYQVHQNKWAIKYFWGTNLIQ